MGTRKYGRRSGQPMGFGRVPRDLHEVIDYVPEVVEGQRTGNQRPVTLIDRATEAIRAGGSLTEAAARCGVDKTTLHDWTDSGQSAIADVLAGRRKLGELSAAERMHAEFAHLMEKARAERALMFTTLGMQLARGGYERRTVRRKTVMVPPEQPGGVPRQQVVEEVTTTETAEPDLAAIKWTAAVTDPQRFGVQRVEVSGPDGGPVESETKVSATDELLAAVAQMAATRSAVEAIVATNGHTTEPAAP